LNSTVNVLEELSLEELQEQEGMHLPAREELGGCGGCGTTLVICVNATATVGTGGCGGC
jgi:hypothetical protein